MEQDRHIVYVSPQLAIKLEAKEKDLLYISDSRAWLGGLRSTHAIIGGIKDSLQEDELEIPSDIMNNVARPNKLLRIKRMY